MSTNFDPHLLSAYLPLDRRLALAYDRSLPERTFASVLFADISGFTLLADALRTALGERRGSEEPAHQLNRVYESLITEINLYGGSVISFSGDAITCWFSESSWQVGSHEPISVEQNQAAVALQATACALKLQEVLYGLASSEVPGLGNLRLQMKASIASGYARRFIVGDPELQQIDAIAGGVLQRMADGEHLALPGEVIIDRQTAALLSIQSGDTYSDIAQIREWRYHETRGDIFAVLETLSAPVEPKQWPSISAQTLELDKVRPWLLPDVYERLNQGLGEFLAEMRPVVVLFMRFAGIDFEKDDNSKFKLDAYIRWVQNVLRRYAGALLNLTIGDKGSYLFAAFGAPIVHDDDAWRAVSAALELRSPPTELDYISHMQFGISQGVLHTGAYGARMRRTYSALGDEVNLAARLMQAAGPGGEILVSNRVCESVGDKCTWRPPITIRVKGKQERIKVASLIDKAASQPSSTKFSGKLIGRTTELKKLNDFISPIFSSEERNKFAGIVYIRGEAGIGKSRLIFELRKRLTGHRSGYYSDSVNAQWLDCPGEPILRQSLHPFRYYLRQYFQQNREFSAEINKERFDQSLGELLSSLPQSSALRRQLERTYSMLGAMVDLHWEDSLYEQLEPKLRFENTLAAFKALILAESLHQPVILHIEDAHGLDPDSFTLLSSLIRNIAAYPVALVLSGRSGEDDFIIDADDQIKTISLNLTELQHNNIRELAAQALLVDEIQSQALPPGESEAVQLGDDLADFLSERSNGNPLFVEQLALDLRERGFVRRKNGVWKILRERVEEVPASINAVLIARLDRLASRVRATVQTASVLGREFEVPILRGMLPNESTLFDLIYQAQSKAIWLPVTMRNYAFRHSALRDTAYQMHTQNHLRQMHARAAESIHQVHSSDLESHYADLAHHYLMAHNHSRAFAYARRAGKQAAAQFANQQAINHYLQALESAAHLDQPETLMDRMDSHNMLGELLVTTGQYQQAQEHLEQALNLATDCDNCDAQARACRWLARLYENRSEYEQALEWIEKGLEILGERKTIESSELLSIAGLISSRRGDQTSAFDFAQRGLQIAQDLQDAKTLALAYNLMGHILRLRSENDNAIIQFQQALELYQQEKNISGQAVSYNQIGNAFFALGRWEEAAQQFELARNTFNQIGDIYRRVFAENNLGWIALTQGRLEQALEYYQQGLFAMEQIGGSPWVLGGFHNNLGSTHIRRGDAQAAIKHLDISQKYFEQAGARDWLPELYRHKAAATLLEDDLPGAQNLAEQALNLARELNMRAEEGCTLRVLAEIAIKKSQAGQAEAFLAQSLDILAKVGDEYEHARSQLSLAGLYTSEGKHAAARTALDECIPVFSRLKAALDLEIARELQQGGPS